MPFLKKQGRKPDFKGRVDISAWVNKTKEGKPYLRLDIGGIKVSLWQQEEEIVPQQQPQQPRVIQPSYQQAPQPQPLQEKDYVDLTKLGKVL